VTRPEASPPINPKTMRKRLLPIRPENRA
jgi:hypothetical protein